MTNKNDISRESGKMRIVESKKKAQKKLCLKPKKKNEHSNNILT